MDRFEIVDPGSNGEAVFLEFRPKWLLNSKIAKMAMPRTKQAGSQYTLFKPLSCPKNGETLKEVKTENQYPVYYPLYEDIEKYVRELDKRKLASRLSYIVSKQRKATLIKTIEVLDKGFNKC